MKGKLVTDDLLIADLRRLAAIFPRLTSWQIKSSGKYAYMTYYKRFGSLAGIRNAAGWTPPVGDPAWALKLTAQAEQLERWPERRCVQFFRSHRWPSGVLCPRCEWGGAVVFLKNQRIGNPEIVLYECRDCRYQFSDVAGTVFHKTAVPIRLWFHALLAWASPGGTAEKARRLGMGDEVLRQRLDRLKGSVFGKALALALIAALEGTKTERR